MKKEEITQIVQKQREFYKTGKTQSVSYRIGALRKLKDALVQYEDKIAEAIQKDLGKSAQESYMCETGLVISEISHMLKHVKRYAKNKTVLTPLAQFASKSYKQPTPYGVVLVMSPWNYPVLLTLDPLVDAIAAGNTVVVKPSNYSLNTTNVLKEMLESIFPSEYVAVITGGREENQALLDEKFDYIFFTGSKNVGTIVLEKAAKHITPVTLELGGKSPCIVDKSADLKLAARRLVFGKYLNCGQTCVAPDYVYCHASIKDQFMTYVKEEIIKQYGTDYLGNNEYGKMINLRAFNRVSGLIDSSKVIHGGHYDEDTLKIEPTVIDNVSLDDPIMQEEIFGPLMPVLTYENIDDVIEVINDRDNPLALYIFANDKKLIKHVTTSTQYGGGCINDVVIHLATSYMGFGGVGESGMGSYHGKVGFDTFTHYKSIVDKKTWLDLPMRYHPFNNKFYDQLIRLFLK